MAVAHHCMYNILCNIPSDELVNYVINRWAQNLRAHPDVNDSNIIFYIFIQIWLFLRFGCYPVRKVKLKDKQKLQINLL